MHLRRYDVEVWMKRRNLSQELKRYFLYLFSYHYFIYLYQLLSPYPCRKVRQAERYKWAATRGVNEGELLEGLPEDLHKEIRRELAYAKDVNLNPTFHSFSCSL